ncbi:MAG: DUF5655 domain-containing protein [Dehalococcoidia bacterium]
MQPKHIWTCDACGREFGKRQSHVCAPAISVDAYYAGRPPIEREIFEVVRAHLQDLGPLIVEPVGIGILFKLKRTFAELRPRTKWVALGFGLNRQLAHQRITRTAKMGPSRGWYGTNLRRPEDFDEQVRAWLTESYLEYAG